MLNWNSSVSRSAASWAWVFRQVWKKESWFPSLSKARYPCIMPEMPRAPTLRRGSPYFSRTRAAREA